MKKCLLLIFVIVFLIGCVEEPVVEEVEQGIEEEVVKEKPKIKPIEEVEKPVVEDVIEEEPPEEVVEELSEEEVELETEVEEVVDDCSDKMLKVSPLALEDLEFIEPLGLLSGSHVTPVDHQYWNVKDEESSNLYAPRSGTITDVGFFKDNNDYRLVIDHGCGLITIYIHVDTLEEKFLEEVEFRDGGSYLYDTVNIPVEEGEVLGTVSGRSFDFSLHDEDVVLSGFIYPEHYESESWKIHTVDPFDYYDEPLRSQLRGKVMRSVEPLGGKIDYDVKDKLVGTWFKEGSGWYAGNVGNYWDGHLSIVYEHYDPTQIRISIGDYNGESRQYGVNGNSPDPKDVGVGDGIIQYELVSYDYYVNGQHWDRETYAAGMTSRNYDSVQGYILFELLGDGKLKVEYSDSEISSFSSKAVVYER